jgi:hypothetical protein
MRRSGFLIILWTGDSLAPPADAVARDLTDAVLEG